MLMTLFSKLVVSEDTATYQTNALYLPSLDKMALKRPVTSSIPFDPYLV